MKRTDFEQLVNEALQELPNEFLEKLKNIVVVVEDYPAKDVLDEMDVDSDEVLFALYEGIPLTERGFFDEPLYPDRILIFQRAFEEEFDSATEIKRELKITIAHEIAHFFGMEDDHLEEIGY